MARIAPTARGIPMIISATVSNTATISPNTVETIKYCRVP
jgi:hypothetical protein